MLVFRERGVANGKTVWLGEGQIFDNGKTVVRRYVEIGLVILGQYDVEAMPIGVLQKHALVGKGRTR